MQFSYETARLHLQVLDDSYADRINQFYTQNRDFLEPFEPARPRQFYTDAFQASNLSYEYSAFFRLSYLRYWLFLRKNPDVLLGTACFSNFSHGAFQKGMIGYKLAQTACGQGYMTEALSFLIPIVMKELRLHRLEAYVQPTNQPSVRLLERLGFSEEGYLTSYAKINGVWTDHLLFSYLPSSADKTAVPAERASGSSISQ